MKNKILNLRSYIYIYIYIDKIISLKFSRINNDVLNVISIKIPSESRTPVARVISLGHSAVYE